MGKVLVKGTIHEIYDQGPETVGANWWLQDCCITLYTRTSGTFHVFFPSKEELEKQRFTKGEKVIVKGFLLMKEVRGQKKKTEWKVDLLTRTPSITKKRRGRNHTHARGS